MGAEHLHILSLNFQHASIEDVGLLHVALEVGLADFETPRKPFPAVMDHQPVIAFDK